MRKIPSLLSALILILMLICAACPATAVSGDMSVGSDILIKMRGNPN